MRRKDREVTDYEVMKDILMSCGCCRLGLCDESGMYIVPLNFGLDDNGGELNLYFHSAREGRKLDMIRNNARVVFEADTDHELVGAEKACGYTYKYKCVMGSGAAEIVTDGAKREHALKKIMEHYSGTYDWEISSEALDHAEIIKVTVTDWSCKVH